MLNQIIYLYCRFAMKERKEWVEKVRKSTGSEPEALHEVTDNLT